MAPLDVNDRGAHNSFGFPLRHAAVGGVRQVRQRPRAGVGGMYLAVHDNFCEARAIGHGRRLDHAFHDVTMGAAHLSGAATWQKSGANAKRA